MPLFGRKLSLSAAVISCSIVTSFAATAPVSDGSPISVPDLVRLARFGDPGSAYDDEILSKMAEIGAISPDRHKMAIVVRWGDPEKKLNFGSIYLLRDGGGPLQERLRLLITKSSKTNQQPLGLLKWLGDNKTLMFAGVAANGSSQVFRLNTGTRAVRQLTHDEHLYSYETNESGNRLVTLDLPPRWWVKDENDATCKARGCLVDATSLWSQGANAKYPTTSYGAGGRGELRLPSPVASNPEIDACRYGALGPISPDGRYGLRTCALSKSQLLETWKDYTGLKDHLKSDEAVVGDGSRAAYDLYLAEGRERLGLPVLIDLVSGGSCPLADVPHFADEPVAWIEHGKRIALIGVPEPLTGLSGDEYRRHAANWGVLAVDPVSRHTEFLGQLDPAAAVRSASWDDSQGRLTVVQKSSAGMITVVFHMEHGQWSRSEHPGSAGVAPPRELKDGTAVSIPEDLHHPQRLEILGPGAKSPTVLLDPNSWLGTRVLGKRESVTWKLHDGRTWSGVLTFPPGFQANIRYPLLLQTHGAWPAEFSLSGNSRNYPGQALAAHGFLVLDVADKAVEVSYHGVGLNEFTSIQDAYESAIDDLDRKGFIDRTKVGITGWSRSGIYASYVITHSNYAFAAAAFTSTGGIGDWYYQGSSPATQGDVDHDYGGSIYEAHGLASWLAQAPGFNMARARTPTLMWENDSVAGLWDWYSAMHRLDVPVEYWYLPESAHELMDVEQRITTVQRMVDWFRYWLKGEKDPTPEKQEQYARWDAMREDFKSVAEKPRPPLLQWTSVPATDEPMHGVKH